MDYSDARRRMVENQVRANKVTDPLVIAAMAALPREAFAPEAMKDIAYVDEAIPLGDGRFLMEPMILARLIEAARVQPTDVVLEIGCGAGYASALLARLASTVVALESDKKLAAKATKTLGSLGIDNVAVIGGKLENGYPKQAPYDVIFVNGCVGQVPSGLTKQLAEGGRLVALFADEPLMSQGWGKAALLTRSGAGVSRNDLFDAGTPALAGFSLEPAFAL